MESLSSGIDHLVSSSGVDLLASSSSSGFFIIWRGSSGFVIIWRGSSGGVCGVIVHSLRGQKYSNPIMNVHRMQIQFNAECKSNLTQNVNPI